jgi:hypothetical protein
MFVTNVELPFLILAFANTLVATFVSKGFYNIPLSRLPSPQLQET